MGLHWHFRYRALCIHFYNGRLGAEGDQYLCSATRATDLESDKVLLPAWLEGDRHPTTSDISYHEGLQRACLGRRCMRSHGAFINFPSESMLQDTMQVEGQCVITHRICWELLPSCCFGSGNIENLPLQHPHGHGC